MLRMIFAFTASVSRMTFSWCEVKWQCHLSCTRFALCIHIGFTRYALDCSHVCKPVRFSRSAVPCFFFSVDLNAPDRLNFPLVDASDASDSDSQPIPLSSSHRSNSASWLSSGHTSRFSEFTSPLKYLFHDPDRESGTDFSVGDVSFRLESSRRRQVDSCTENRCSTEQPVNSQIFCSFWFVVGFLYEKVIWRTGFNK